MNLLIVVVCYRVPDLTVECLRSLRDEIAAIPDSHVTICENGTGQESTRVLQTAIETEGWESWVSLTVIHPNRGFAGGNNVILRQALSSDNSPRHILLLNADTVVLPGALQELMKAARQHPEAGIIGPRLESQDGVSQVSCFRYHHPLSEFIRGAQTGPITRMLSSFEVPMGVFERPTQPQWISFACALIRREVFEQVGLLDEGFYLYYDDVDFCCRARAAGWQILYWPSAHVVHLEGRSNPVVSLGRQRKRQPRYFYASRARCLAKKYGLSGLWLCNVFWTIGRGISWIRELGGRPRHACAYEWRDIWIGSLNSLDKLNSIQKDSELTGEHYKTGGKQNGRSKGESSDASI